MVDCPICGKQVFESRINDHIDSSCLDYLLPISSSQPSQNGRSPQVANFFRSQSEKKIAPNIAIQNEEFPTGETTAETALFTASKRQSNDYDDGLVNTNPKASQDEPPPKRFKLTAAMYRAAPLAERVRPNTLDQVYGQELVGPTGVLRGLIEADRVPSMILWGAAGTGKTTIARVIAQMVGSRFVEINSTSSGVGECKKIFAEAGNELRLTGRKTIIFCDEIHRFSKSQQDVFLGPVESGQITLIGATTENPSFKVQSALLSRCRTFTLQKLADIDIVTILNRALEIEGPNYAPSSLVDDGLINYLAAFADGDARTALNLLELAMDISKRPSASQEMIKSALAKTLVYDRAGDQHCELLQLHTFTYY